MDELARADEEAALVRAFIVKSKQERCITFLKSSKRRTELTEQFAHFKWLDTNHCYPLPKGVHTVSEIAKFLRNKGAGKTCWLISESKDIDKREMKLEEALSEVRGREIGTFISCIPGRLGYFEDEEQQAILER